MSDADVSRLRGKTFRHRAAQTPEIVSHRGVSLARVRFADDRVPSMTIGRRATAREFLDAWGDADVLFAAVRRARYWPVEMRAARLKMRAPR